MAAIFFFFFNTALSRRRMMDTRLSADSDLTRGLSSVTRDYPLVLAPRPLFRSRIPIHCTCINEETYRTMYFRAGYRNLRQRTFEILRHVRRWRPTRPARRFHHGNNDGRSASFSEEQKVTNCYGVNEIGRG